MLFLDSFTHRGNQVPKTTKLIQALAVHIARQAIAVVEIERPAVVGDLQSPIVACNRAQPCRVYTLPSDRLSLTDERRPFCRTTATVEVVSPELLEMSPSLTVIGREASILGNRSNSSSVRSCSSIRGDVTTSRNANRCPESPQKQEHSKLFHDPLRIKGLGC